MIADKPDTRTRRYQGAYYVKPIDEANRLVPVIDLADRFCGAGGLRRIGKEWVGRCPLPDHQDLLPSFCVNPETNSWHCFSCLRGGGVVELYRIAQGYSERGADFATAMLLIEFGHEVPKAST